MIRKARASGEPTATITVAAASGRPTLTENGAFSFVEDEARKKGRWSE